MIVDRTQFLFLASALAAGTTACQSDPYGRSPTPTTAAPAPTPSVVTPAGPVIVELVEAAAPGVAACDDTQGVPEECPAVGPSDEGICPNLITKRCDDFKAAMKPRVAAQAVACLRALKGSERCDPARISQCGHLALMAACPEPARPKKGELHPASGTTLASVTITPDPSPETSPVAVSCTSLLKTCGERPLSPTLADCKQTLAGMTESGRTNTVACVTAHCTDRGLLGCEAAAKVVTANTSQ